MTKTGTTYFRDELSHWFKILDFYRNEIPLFEERLVELIQNQAAPEQMNQAETFLNEFAELHNKINLLQMEIKRLKADSIGPGNGTLEQDTLRNNMQTVEKDFVEIKYRCHQFLAAIHRG